jgi:glycosyltransferase involved in cell wall biosynthesis
MNLGIVLRGVNDVGGVGEYMRSLLHALLRLDRRNRYILFLCDGKAAAQFAQYPNAVAVTLGTKRRMLFDEVFVPWAARRHRCDVIINLKHSVPLLTGAHTVMVMHGADWIAFPQNYYFLHRLYHGVSLPVFCRKADRIICVSKDAAELAIRHLKLPRSKFATIYHGCRSEFVPVADPARRKAVRQRYRLPDRFILYVGWIYPMKTSAV